MAFKPVEKNLPTPMPIIKCLPRAIHSDSGVILRDGMKFWCPYCKTWHTHGRGKGHRVAHCVIGRNYKDKEASPFIETGYIIEMIPKAELGEIRKEIEAYLSYKRDRKKGI